MDFSVIVKQLETADYSQGSGLVGNEPLVVRMMNKLRVIRYVIMPKMKTK